MKELDNLLTSLGGFGRYQRRIFILLLLPGFAIGFQKFSGVFVQFTSGFRCKLPGEDASSSYSLSKEKMEESYPFDSETQSFSSCTYMKNGKEVECDSWIFDRSVFKTSTVMDWDLVCQYYIYRQLSDSCFMAGEMSGSIFFGWLSDRIGRLKTYYLALILIGPTGFFLAFMPNNTCFMLIRIVDGAVNVGGYIVGYVIAMELVGPKWRAVAGIILQVSFSCGALSLCGVAYFEREWRKLMMVISIPPMLFVSYWFLIPESIRWLIAHEEYSQAEEGLREVARVNKKEVDETVMKKVRVETENNQQQSSKKVSIFSIIHYRSLRLRILLVFFAWFCNNLAFYSFSWNTGQLLSGDFFLNYALTEMVELPAYLIVILALARFGRKTMLCTTMIIGGAGFICSAFIPESIHWLKVTCALIGKMAVTAAYGILYIFTVELFPTVIRNVVVGASSFVARFGGVVSPYVVLLSEYWLPLPFLVMGGLMGLGGLAAFFLPETFRRRLPDTMEEGESFGAKPSNAL